jgi:hypothetical protein
MSLSHFHFLKPATAAFVLSVEIDFAPFALMVIPSSSHLHHHFAVDVATKPDFMPILRAT